MNCISIELIITKKTHTRQNDNNDIEYDAGDDISDDNGENDENANLCECYNTWRRASNDGDDDDEFLDENVAAGVSAKKQKNSHNRNSSNNNGGQRQNATDSGCDSDCPENISELCKKFDENLSEQDVSCSDGQMTHAITKTYISFIFYSYKAIIEYESIASLINLNLLW